MMTSGCGTVLGFCDFVFVFVFVFLDTTSDTKCVWFFPHTNQFSQHQMGIQQFNSDS